MQDRPRGLDFTALAAGDFEQLCFQVVRLSNERVERLRAPDAGADLLERGPDGDRAWQVKAFSRSIHWAQAEESLDTAAEHFELVEYTFCFSVDLTVNDQDRLAALREKHPRITIDAWGASVLSAQLLSSASGREIAKAFFEDGRPFDSAWELAPEHWQRLHAEGKTNLDWPAASFHGRRSEILDLSRARKPRRYICVTGAPGVGKSALAERWAMELAGSHPDGVWLARLASLDEPALLAPAVLAATGGAERPGEPPLDTLRERLADSQVVLLLDNCEHLATACQSLIGALTAACQRLTLIATSREPLDAPGEFVFELEPLETETSGSDEAHSHAVALFLERAAAVRPSLRRSPPPPHVVAEICRNLDGIPLAVELAAAWMEVLGAKEIEREVEADALRLMTEPAGDRSVAVVSEAVARSYRMLMRAEQAAWRRCSVFSGGWTTDSAEAVIRDDAWEGDVLETLRTLRRRSLIAVTSQHGDPQRHRMHEVLRAYAARRLLEDDDASAVRSRHADRFLAVAEETRRYLRGASSVPALRRLDAERANMRVALDWLIEQGDAKRALAITGALGRYWQMRGVWAEGQRFCELALAMPDRHPESRERLSALNSAGHLASRRGELDLARRLREAQLELAEKLGDERDIADAVHRVAIIDEYQGRFELARVRQERALELAEAQNYLSLVGDALHYLGSLAAGRGEVVEAMRLHERAFNVRSIRTKEAEDEDEWGALWSRIFLGALMRQPPFEDRDRARAHLEAALHGYKARDDPRRVDIAHMHLGLLAADEGDLDTARVELARALEIADEVGDLRGAPDILDALCHVLCWNPRQRELGLKFASLAGVLRARMGAVMHPADLERRNTAIERCRTGGGARSARAWEIGATLSLGEAVALARRAAPKR